MIGHNYTSFQDPRIKYPIDDFDLSFSDYIDQCKILIRNTRTDLVENPKAELIIEANSPFELKPSGQNIRSGALLLHGLFDCPFIMRDIGAQLQSQGLLVRSILLPGHGTVPGGLLNVSYQDWIQAMRYGIASLEKEVDQIFLVGFSMGGALSLYQALENSSQLAGLILLAPAVKVRSRFSAIAGWPRPFNKKWKRSRWLQMTEEIDYTKYQSITFNSVYQVCELTKAVQQLHKTHSLTCPLFIAISQDDRTVSSVATLHYFQQYASAESRLILYTRKPEIAKDSRITMRPAVYPEWNINNISHIAIPNAPDNPHYGKDGDYIYASYVEKNLREGMKYSYGTYNNLENKTHKIFYRLGLNRNLRMRLTFNPDFEFLVQGVKGFVEANSKS